MILPQQQFADYLRNNEGKKYLVEGTEFSFSLHHPREDDFPYSIRFSSDQWSENTIRAVGARRIVSFLAIFNKDPDLPWREYKNQGVVRSTATVAKYLVHLMGKASELGD